MYSMWVSSISRLSWPPPPACSIVGSLDETDTELAIAALKCYGTRERPFATLGSRKAARFMDIPAYKILQKRYKASLSFSYAVWAEPWVVLASGRRTD